MWICVYCETNNIDSAGTCICCGKAKKTLDLESENYINAGADSNKCDLKPAKHVRKNSSVSRESKPFGMKLLLAGIIAVCLIVAVCVLNKPKNKEAIGDSNGELSTASTETGSLPYLSLAEFSDYDEYLEELENVLSTVEGIDKVYVFGDSSLTMLTKSGKVLSTDGDYGEAAEWSDITSLCAGHSGSGYYDVLFGVRSDGTVQGIGPDSVDSLINEVTGWENVISVNFVQTYDENGDNHGGLYARCSDGYLECTSSLDEVLNIGSGTKLKDLSWNTAYSSDWAAVTDEGKVITNVESLLHDTSGWSNIERVWLVATYNEKYIIGRKEDGSTVLAADEYYYSDEFLKNDEDVSGFKRIKSAIESLVDISDIEYDYEYDYLAAGTDNGKAEILFFSSLCWLSDSSQNDFQTTDFSNIENALSWEKLFMVEPENSESYIDGPVFAVVCKDGSICDSICGENVVRFVPEDSNARIKSIVSVCECLGIFGLTQNGTVTRIHCEF